ncbi:hypothetical protein [Mycobacterium sp. 1081908.1]|uniref:hypothetical protein n=1 Tax=Mycobacterium sp. 1081908.1 TaxID=1834066 RepID=UPI001E4448C0|nr:hypothetical protein [Mycobacterium sp. 1081908.1]
MAVETSSPAAASTPVVGAAAAAWAALTVDPMLAKVVVASDITSGTANKSDIRPLQQRHVKRSRPDYSDKRMITISGGGSARFHPDHKRHPADVTQFRRECVDFKGNSAAGNEPFAV